MNQKERLEQIRKIENPDELDLEMRKYVREFPGNMSIKDSPRPVYYKPNNFTLCRLNQDDTVDLIRHYLLEGYVNTTDAGFIKQSMTTYLDHAVEKTSEEEWNQWLQRLRDLTSKFE